MAIVLFYFIPDLRIDKVGKQRMMRPEGWNNGFLCCFFALALRVFRSHATRVETRG